MKAASTLALLAVAGSTTAAAAAPRSSYFHLVATPKPSGSSPPPHFQGNYLTSFHVGAGQSTIVTERDIQHAATFYIEDGALVQNSSYPFVVSFIDQRPYMSDAPEGYKYVSLDIGSPENGSRPFVRDAKTGIVRYTAGKDLALSICNVNGTSPYFSVGPQSQLLWRSLSTSKEDARKPRKCADVDLHAVDVKA